MKRLFSVILSVCIICSCMPSVFAQTVASDVDIAEEDVLEYELMTANSEVTARPGTKPGLNMVTSTTEPCTFEGDTSNFSNFFTISRGSVADNPIKDDINDSESAVDVSITNEGAFLAVEFYPQKALEADRPFHISFKYLKTYENVGDETYNPFPALWVMRNGGAYIASALSDFVVAENWKSYSALINMADAYDAATGAVSPEAVNSIILMYAANANPGTTHFYFDDISYIPYYKISYMANDGTDTETAHEYVLYEDDDITKPIVTSYTINNEYVPENRYKYEFAGWSTDPNATEPMDTVAIGGNEDVVLYAVWKEDESLPDATTLKWDFETEASHTWGKSYGIKYENGIMILDNTVINDDYYISHSEITGADTLNTGALRYLVVKARSLDTVSNIKFYFKTSEHDFTENENESTVVNIPIDVGSSVFKEYYVDMTSNDLWTGDYENCMLQLNGGSGVVEIEEIYFTTLYEVTDSLLYEYHVTLSDSVWGHTWIKNNSDGTLTMGKNENGYYVDGNGYVQLYKDGNVIGYYDTENNVYYDTSYNAVQSVEGEPAVSDQGGFFMPNLSSNELNAANYPYLVIKGKTDTLTNIKSYYVTTDNPIYSEMNTVEVNGNDFSDGYRYWIFDYSERSDYTGNITGFMMSPGSGKAVISDIYFTNTLPGGSEDMAVEIEKVYLDITSETISEDNGTVTVSPYIRYTDGSVEDDFSEVYYITDSVAAQVIKNDDGTATVTAQMNGTVNITAVFPDGTTALTKTLTITGQKERLAANSFKVLMIGNSIRWHFPAPWVDANGNTLETSEGSVYGMGWNGNWGMAASSEDKDYAHRFIYYMNQKYGEGAAELIPVGHPPAGFEAAASECAEYNAEDFVTYVNGFIDPVKEYKPDIVTLQLGENGGGAQSSEVYAKIMAQVIKGIKEAAPDAIIVISTPFWSSDVDAKVIGTYAAAEECGIMVAPVHNLGKDRNNMALDSDFVANAIEGVKIHPGDTGMDNIAKMFFEKVNITLSANERTEYTTVPQSIEVTSDGEMAITDAYGTLKLNAVVSPSDAAQGIKWTVDNKDIGTVDENGLVTAINNGTLKVTATSKFVDTLSKTVEVTISGQTTPYTVTYDKNTTDEVTGMPEANYLAKENFVFDVVYPVRSTYKFLGWSLKADGTAEDIITSCDITENTTVYAIWEKAYRWSFERTDYQEEFVVENGFNQYVLNGYFTTIATGTDLENGVVLKVISPKLDINPSDYHALVLRMKSSEATSSSTVEMTIKATGGNVTFTKPIPSTDYHDYEFLLDGIDGTITGFEFKPADADTTIYIDNIEFAKNPIFKYDANTTDSSVAGMPAGIYDSTVTEVTLSEDIPTRAGYKFLGWARTADSKLLIEEPVAISDSGMTTVYAVWDRNDHWEMDSASEVDVWSVDSAIVEDGELTITVKTDDGECDVIVNLIEGFGFNVDNSKKVVFRAKYDLTAPDTAQMFYWTSDTNTNAATGDYVQNATEAYVGIDGNYKSEDYRDYTFDFTSSKNFSGTIRGMRFDPHNHNGTFVLDWVRFADSEANIVTAADSTRKLSGEDAATHIVKTDGTLAPIGSAEIKSLALAGNIDMSEGYITVTDNIEIADGLDYAVYTLDMATSGISAADEMYISGCPIPVTPVDGAKYIIKTHNGTGYVAFKKNGSSEVTVNLVGEPNDNDETTFIVAQYNSNKMAYTTFITYADFADGKATFTLGEGNYAKLITFASKASLMPVFEAPVIE